VTAPRRVGLIGYGAIGAELCRYLTGDAGLEVVSVLTRQPRAGQPGGPPLTTDPDAFFAARPDIVVEGAGHDALRQHGLRALQSGADLVVTSIGAFAADEALLDRLKTAAGLGRLVLASAGIGALDILAGAAVGGLDRVLMTVRKDPSAWIGTAAEAEFDLAAVREPLVIFRGSPRAGAAKYPQNVNISAAVALAGLGLDRTELVIVADPTIDTHVIEVEAWGAFGRFRFVEDVAVSPANRKTGRIVAMAVAKTVRQLAGAVQIGG
jgi:aspartate dehydrogenase